MPQNAKRSSPKIYFGMGNVKMHVFHGNPILCSSKLGGGGGGGRPTNAIISRVLLIIEH